MDEVDTVGEGRARRVHAAPVVLLVFSLVVTGLLAAVTAASYDDTEDRLLAERTQAASSVFATTLPSLVAPLAGTAALAEATDADEAALRDFLEPQVGEEARFDSVSIWPAEGTEPLLVVGGELQLTTLPAEEIRTLFDRAVDQVELALIDLLERDVPSLGYATAAPEDPEYVVYAEIVLPPDRTTRERAEAPFQDLEYALYLGSEADDAELLVANSENLPLAGRTDRITVPFGDNELLLVLRPTKALGGPLGGRIPWLIVVFGVALTGAFVLLLERMLRSRDRAMALAVENGRLYDEQRSVASAVQHSLLPAELPRVAGLELEARYQAGVAGTEVGGDWYDVVALGDQRVLVVVGDVAGRGIRAAAVMAMLRHATRAYAIDGDDPADLPGKLTRLMRLDDDSGFATLLLMDVDLAARTVTVVNAGHPRPLLVDGDGRFLDAPVGLPVGVEGDRSQGTVRVEVPVGATLLAFTDGLFERRGESVDEGMERLRSTVVADQPLGDVLDGLLTDLSTGAEADDVAIVGVRW